MDGDIEDTAVAGRGVASTSSRVMLFGMVCRGAAGAAVNAVVDLGRAERVSVGTGIGHVIMNRLEFYAADIIIIACMNTTIIYLQMIMHYEYYKCILPLLCKCAINSLSCCRSVSSSTGSEATFKAASISSELDNRSAILLIQVATYIPQS